MKLDLPYDARNCAGGINFMAAIPSGHAKLAWFDPQHRAILDQQDYGNEGTRQRGRSVLPSMDDEMIGVFLEELERIVKPSGYVMLWLDKFCLVEGRHLHWLRRTALNKVGAIIWNKTVMGQGARERYCHEHLLVLQRAPVRAKATWADRSIRDVWTEEVDRQRHPHAKPIQLAQRIIRATTARRDVVVDPAAGGYGILDACIATQRRFLGCDLLEWTA